MKRNDRQFRSRKIKKRALGVRQFDSFAPKGRLLPDPQFLRRLVVPDAPSEIVSTDSSLRGSLAFSVAAAMLMRSRRGRR